MKTSESRSLLAMAVTVMALLLLSANGFADTPGSNNEKANGHMMYPYGMRHGMGPGNMPYGDMGPGYMHRGGAYGGGMGYHDMGMMQALNLSKEQRAKLRSLLREHRTARCKAMSEMFDVRDELAAEYDKDRPDPKAVGRLYNKMAEMQRHMLEQSVRTRNKMRALLNKDQKEIFDRMFHGAMGFGMGYGGMGMMGYGGMMHMME